MSYNIMGRGLDSDLWEFVKKAQKASTGEELTEASLGRVYFYIELLDSPFAIITYHNSLSPNELAWDLGSEGEESIKRIADNRRENREAKLKFFETLKEMEVDYAYLIGHGLDEYDGEMVSVREPCYVLADITLVQAEKLMKEFGQNGIVFSGPETEGRMCLIGKDGKKLKESDEFSPLKAADFYAEVKGKSKYVFECIPQSINEGLWTQSVSHCTKIPGIKRWQELAEEGMKNPMFFNV